MGKPKIPKTAPEKIYDIVVDRLKDSQNKMAVAQQCTDNLTLNGVHLPNQNWKKGDAGRYRFITLSPKYRYNPELMQIMSVGKRLELHVHSNLKTFEELPQSVSLENTLDGQLNALAFCFAEDPDCTFENELSTMGLFVALTRFKHSKHVYRFDETTLDDLYSANIENIPLCYFEKTPYPAMYLEMPDLPTCRVSPTNEVAYTGAFVSLQQNSTPTLEITFISPYKDDTFYSNTISLAFGSDSSETTVGEKLEQCESDYPASFKADSVYLVDEYRYAIQCARKALSLLTFIISQEADQEVVYTPTKQSNQPKKKTRRTSSSTIHIAGRHYGSRIKRQRQQSHQTALTTNPGHRKAPHVRRAHWHHYWTGPIDEPEKRKLIVKWVDWTFVNMGNGEQDTVIHRS